MRCRYFRGYFSSRHILKEVRLNSVESTVFIATLLEYWGCDVSPVHYTLVTLWKSQNALPLAGLVQQLLAGMAPGLYGVFE